MKKKAKRNVQTQDGFVLGDRTFAAITAVEGLSLTQTSRNRLTAMKKRKLTNDEQRSEVIFAYSGAKDRR